MIANKDKKKRRSKEQHNNHHYKISQFSQWKYSVGM